MLNITYMTGLEGTLLVNYAIIDEKFYSTSINFLVVLVTIVIFALFLIAMGIYIYKTRIPENPRTTKS